MWNGFNEYDILLWAEGKEAELLVSRRAGQQSWNAYPNTKSSESEDEVDSRQVSKRPSNPRGMASIQPWQGRAAATFFAIAGILAGAIGLS